MSFFITKYWIYYEMIQDNIFSNTYYVKNIVIYKVVKKKKR